MFLLAVACTLMLFMEGSGWPDDNCSQTVVRSQGRYIYGGRKAKDGEFPWMVYFDIVTANETLICGGSIIKRDVVLTAAHCILLSLGFNTSESSFYAGSLDLKKVGLYLQRRKIKQFITHEDYMGDVTKEHSNDIALIKLTRPFDFAASQGRIGTVCLAVMPPRPGKFVTVAGWGFTSPDGNRSYHLLAVTVPVIKDKICRTTHIHFYRPKLMFCAGENSKQSGKGDSGGAAVVRTARKSLQVGIASFTTTNNEYTSLVFTKVSTYTKWIIDTLKKLK